MYEQIIGKFLYLLQEQLYLFTESKSELEQFGHTLSPEAGEVSSAIVRWCKMYPAIYDALLEIPDDKSHRGYERITPNPPASNPQRDYGELVRNQIRVSASQSSESSSSEFSSPESSSSANPKNSCE